MGGTLWAKGLPLQLDTQQGILFVYFFKSSPEDMFIDFRERGMGRGERNTDERNMNWLPPPLPLTRDPMCNLLVSRGDAPTN